MKQYEYRLAILEFDSTRHEGEVNGKTIQGLEPGERIKEVFNLPKADSTTGNWQLNVLIEKETTCFPVSNMDPDELTAILKGELK